MLCSFHNSARTVRYIPIYLTRFTFQRPRLLKCTTGDYFLIFRRSLKFRRTCAERKRSRGETSCYFIFLFWDFSLPELRKYRYIWYRTFCLTRNKKSLCVLGRSKLFPTLFNLSSRYHANQCCGAVNIYFGSGSAERKSKLRGSSSYTNIFAAFGFCYHIDLLKTLKITFFDLSSTFLVRAKSPTWHLCCGNGSSY